MEEERGRERDAWSSVRTSRETELTEDKEKQTETERDRERGEKQNPFPVFLQNEDFALIPDLTSDIDSIDFSLEDERELNKETERDAERDDKEEAEEEVLPLTRENLLRNEREILRETETEVMEIQERDETPREAERENDNEIERDRGTEMKVSPRHAFSLSKVAALARAALLGEERDRERPTEKGEISERHRDIERK